VQQFLSIPSNTQLPATSAGGVVDLNRQYGAHAGYAIAAGLKLAMMLAAHDGLIGL